VAPCRGPKQKQIKSERAMAGQGMRLTLKGSTPSAVARLKYITRQGKYASGTDGDRDDLVAVGSGNLPSWASEADTFWLGVDQFERVNARLCVELELNLPPELTLDQQQQVVEAYVGRLLGTERLPYTWAIHDGMGKNPHIHLMFQERGLDGVDRPNAQAWFKRANSKAPSKGGAKKSRAITGANWTFQARILWAEAVNEGLQAAGHEPRFDHRPKAVQRDEALRSGDLRLAAALGTITERHEGAAVYGMRRRVDRGEIEIDDLPEYAASLIRQNDRARAYNNALRDWARAAPESELVQRLSADLVELRERLDQENPGEHVAVWQRYQDQLAIDLGQAHTEALVEWVQRALARVEELKPAAVRPRAVDDLIELKRQAKVADIEARDAEENRLAWHKKHKLAALVSRIGIDLQMDQIAFTARQAAVAANLRVQEAPEMPVAAAWQRADRELRCLQEQLPEMVRNAGMQLQIDNDARKKSLLDDSSRYLLRAMKLVQTQLHGCNYNERDRLMQLRRDIERQQQILLDLRNSQPTMEECEQILDASAQRFASTEGWRQILEEDLKLPKQQETDLPQEDLSQSQDWKPRLR